MEEWGSNGGEEPCSNPNCPGWEMKKSSAKEGDCICLLKTKAIARYHFSCCLIWTSHAPLCTYYVTLNLSLPVQNIISFLSSKRLSDLWGRESGVLMEPSFASKWGGKLQRKMGLLLIIEAEERTASQTAVKGEGGKGWEGKKTMAESHCGEGGFSSSSALLRLLEQRIPLWLQAFRFCRWGCEPRFSLRSQRVGNSFLPLISSTPPTCPLRHWKQKLMGAALQSCRHAAVSVFYSLLSTMSTSTWPYYCLTLKAF